MKKIFLAYASVDRQIVAPLARLLKASNDFEVFDLHEDVPFGEDVPVVLKSELGECDVVIAILTSNFFVISSSTVQCDKYFLSALAGFAKKKYAYLMRACIINGAVGQFELSVGGRILDAVAIAENIVKTLG